MRYRPLLLTALATSLAAMTHPAPATTSKPTLDDVQNIVVIFAENRGFDHLYGMFPGANGLAFATQEQKQQRDRDGSVLPFETRASADLDAPEAARPRFSLWLRTPPAEEPLAPALASSSTMIALYR